MKLSINATAQDFASNKCGYHRIADKTAKLDELPVTAQFELDRNYEDGKPRYTA